MTEFSDHSPRRYFVDQAGRRVLTGLTIEETTEFETRLSMRGQSRCQWRNWSFNDDTGETLVRTLQQARPGVAGVDGRDLRGSSRKFRVFNQSLDNLKYFVSDSHSVE
jgi:hypothetical protein